MFSLINEEHQARIAEATNHPISNPSKNAPLDTKSNHNFKIPFDTAPKSAVLKPGEKIRLYGWIYFENKTDQDIDIDVVFHLNKGFEVTAKDLNRNVLAKELVAMHTKYQLNQDNTIQKSMNQTASMRILRNAKKMV